MQKNRLYTRQIQRPENAMTRSLIIGLALLALTACETAKGVGRDVQKAGGAIANTAEDIQKAL